MSAAVIGTLVLIGYLGLISMILALVSVNSNEGDHDA